MISFTMKRRNKTVTLQWEPFTGQLGANGVAYLTANQTIANMPSYPLRFPLFISYNGETKCTFLMIDPSSREQIKFYLDAKADPTNVKIGDTVFVSGSSVNWIID
jgi:hypothetical protein